MSEQSKRTGKASPEQVSYANMLFYGSWTGLAIMVVTYVLYVTGIVPPHIPLEKMPLLWSQPVHTYLELGQVPVGWGWASLIAKGDFLNFVGIVLLASMTIICYIPLIPVFVKRKEYLFAVLAVAEILVLVLAASGIFGAGAE